MRLHRSRAWGKSRKWSAKVEHLEPRQLLAANPVIGEFVALNQQSLADEDGDFSGWIELENRGDATADLAGYYLTNDVEDLTKWQVPAGTELAAGEFLVVFASAKDRTAGELHTNFELDELGGDLLLVAADGSTIVTDFSSHPPLGADQAFGSFRPSGDANYISESDSLRYLVPEDDSLGTTWTGGNAGFDDSLAAGWTPGLGPIGYDTTVASDGFTVEVFDGGTVNSIATADALIAAGNNPVVETHSVVNFHDLEGGGGTGNYGDDQPFPGDTNADDNGFAMRATATFFISDSQAGDWTFGFNSDDGGRIRVDGSEVVVDDANHAPEDHLGSITLAAGEHTIEYVYWENTGGATSELWASPGNFASFNPASFSLIGDPDGSLPLANLDDSIATDIEAVMFDQNASVYGRYSFDVAEPSDITTLTLNATLDDGAIIYLNGVQVFATNAPASPTFNSTALADSGVNSVRADLTPFLSELRAGENTLAIHGMNAGAGDSEYFAALTLSGREFKAETAGVINVATPGRPNGIVSPVITEFQATNRGTLDDEDDDSSDWFEVHNPGLVDITLTDWYATDDPTELAKWQFPETTLEANEYLVVFASGKDRAVVDQQLHTNFQLNSSGEYLALVQPDGMTAVWEYEPGGEEYTTQFPDVSFGLRGNAIIEDGTVIIDDDPVQGLVAYWDFEEGVGTALTDVTGNGFDGALQNMEDTDWVTGRSADTTALVFDGEDEFIETMATASALGFPDDTQRTVAGWVRPTAFFQGAVGGVFGMGSPDNRFNFVSTSILGTTYGAEFNGERIGTTVSASTWFHFAVSYDGLNVRLYVDGEVVSEAEFLDLTTDDVIPFTIGEANGDFFKGQIDELAVWDLALDSDVIADLATEVLTPRTAPTVNRLIGVDRTGFRVRQVNASPTFAGQVTGEVGGGDNPLADADQLLGLPVGDPGIGDEVTFVRNNINMFDDAVGGPRGLFGDDDAFPLDDFEGDDDHFALSASATVRIPEGEEGDFTFAIHSDEGARLTIDGVDVIVDNSRHEASLQTGTINLPAGDHTLELTYFEHTGNATLELLYASVTDGIRDAKFDLLEILPDQLPPEVSPNVFFAERVFFVGAAATPGAPNTRGVEIFIDTNTLSMPHGFYEEPFELEITNSTPGVEIYYTVNGTEPSADNPEAVLYEGPITIDQTTALRATAFLEDAAPSRTATATYLFIDDVLTQSPDSSRPEGVPDGWNPSGTQSAWGMDPDIVNDPTWGPLMEEALKQVPTYSIVMDYEDIFGQDGIYTRASQRGRDWERPASLELIYPDGMGPDDGFQVNSGIRVRGGFSRDNGNPKHAFRFFFRTEYGDSKLNYDLFDEPGADVFDKIDLRTTQNYSWAFQNDTRNTFLRDIFSRDLQAAMGQPSTRGDYAHVYVNGQYWGLFQTQERPDRNYAATNNGGDPEDYDVVHNVNPGGQGSGRFLGAIDGTLDSSERLWNEFVKPGGLSDANMDDYYRVQGMNPDGTRNASFERMLDVDNLIDYMMITYYTSDADGPGSEFTRPGINNYFGFYNRENPDGFKFLEWDSEHSLNTGDPAGANFNMVSPFVNNGDDFNRFNAHWMHEQLANQNSDYRQRFIDRIDELMAPGGLLDPDNVAAMLQTRADEIDVAIVAESARWGDAKRATPFTKNDWDSAVTATINWTQNRNADLLNQFRCAGDGSQNRANPDPETCTPEVTAWYPDFNPPLVEPDSGVVPDNTTVTMTAPGNFMIEERLLATSAVVRRLVPDQAFHDANGDSWTDPAFSDSSWRFGAGEIGYEDETGFEDLIRSDVPGRDGDGRNGTTSVYVRPFTKFSVVDTDEDGDLTDEFLDVVLRVRYDDGFIAYLNGTRIASANAPANPSFDSVATAEHDDVEAVEYEDFVLGPNALAALQPTNNVLAFHALNESDESSDLLIGWRLEATVGVGERVSTAQIYYTTDGTDPRASGNDPGATAVAYKDQNGEGQPFNISGNTVVKARSFRDGLWSSITERVYQVTAPTIAVTEINYNPHDPTDDELAINELLDNDDFEFLEVQNNGPITTSLAGISIDNGVTFDFPSVTLDPGEAGVVVRDQPAFELRYGTDINVLGSFASGGLSNAGESIRIVDGLGMTLLEFSYNDADAWSQRADGDGATLELLDPDTPASLYSKHYSWQGSTEFGGTPGAMRSDPVGVVVNEVLTNTDDAGVSDAIELLNTTDAAIDISGWYLSDAGGNLLKYAIPGGTVLGAGEAIVFDESHFNPTPVMPSENDFALSSAGDDVYVVISDGMGRVQSFVDDVHFDAAFNGQAFGRVPNGQGRLAPLGRPSLGCTNGDHQVSDLIVSEVNYNPGDPSEAALAIAPDLTSGDLEFIELHNPTDAAIDLTDWRIRGGVSYDFDEGIMIDAGETVVIIQFNPENVNNASRVSAFRTHYGIGNVRILGGYGGQLSSNGDRIQLQRPDFDVVDPTDPTHVYEDEILFDSLAPWATSANGGGDSLQRRAPSFYGNAADTWQAEVPTPGSATFEGNITGDFNGDGMVDVQDIDMLTAAVHTERASLYLDLDGSGEVDRADTAFLVENILGSHMGDTNLDGAVDASDLNVLVLHWQESSCITWANGNFDGNDIVDAVDLNFIALNWLTAVAAPLGADAVVADGGIVPDNNQLPDLGDDREANNRSLPIEQSEAVWADVTRIRQDRLIARRWQDRVNLRSTSQSALHKPVAIDKAGVVDAVFAGFRK